MARERGVPAADGVTALHWAAINNHVAVARCLLEHGADVNAVGGDLQATPLLWAARQGHIQLARLLVQAGANVEARDRQGFNSLHTAAQVRGPGRPATRKRKGADR